MSESGKKKTALISVYTKDGIEDFAGRLVKLGWEILSSGGTAKFLAEKGIPVKDVAELVGGGAILGHRVVTLSREVHAGLLARDNEEDRAELENLGVPFIDMVVCDFYPLREEIAKEGATVDSVINQTDIGGPTMVRSGAKGGRIVVIDPLDRKTVIEQLEFNDVVTPGVRQYLRAKAEYIVAGYCLDSVRFHGKDGYDGLLGIVVMDLAYGENRDQSPAALYAADLADPLAWGKFNVLTGQPSYISIGDGDRALGVMCALAESFRFNLKKVPQIAVACKHGNPCGIGVSFESPTEALLKALMGDSLAVMGAEVMINFAIDKDLGLLLFRVPDKQRERVGREFWGIDVLYAPAVDADTIELLGKKDRRRILVNPALADPHDSKQEFMLEPVRGGFLRQKSYHYILDFSNLHSQTGKMSESQKIDAIIAWAAAWRSVSNTVALAKEGMLIGLGCGQQDRIACVQLCLDRAKRAGHDTTGAIFASDAFFPFARRKREEDPREGSELLWEALCAGGIVPYDGKNAQEVYDFFNQHHLLVGFLPPEHRGFFGHG